MFPALNATQQVEQVLRYCGLGRAESRTRAVAALETMGLGQRLRQKPSELSGGEKQRVAIARALDSVSGQVIIKLPRGNNCESALPDVHAGQEAEITSESDASKTFPGKVIRIAATFGGRKNKSETGTEATDERVVEVVVSATGTPYLIGQRVMVKFLKPGKKAVAKS